MSTERDALLMAMTKLWLLTKKQLMVMLLEIMTIMVMMAPASNADNGSSNNDEDELLESIPRRFNLASVVSCVLQRKA